VFKNLILHNVVDGNGLVGEGAGVVLASPVPGGAVYDNTVAYNEASGNGLAGVTIHSHLPGQNLNGNVIKANTLGTNNLDGDDPGIGAPLDMTDSQTTGILVASAGPLSVSIQGNIIHDDHFGVWTDGPVSWTGHQKDTNVTVPVFPVPI
jgi:hypothetical protein